MCWGWDVGCVVRVRFVKLSGNVKFVLSLFFKVVDLCDGVVVGFLFFGGGSNVLMVVFVFNVVWFLLFKFMKLFNVLVFVNFFFDEDNFFFFKLCRFFFSLRVVFLFFFFLNVFLKLFRLIFVF